FVWSRAAAQPARPAAATTFRPATIALADPRATPAADPAKDPQTPADTKEESTSKDKPDKANDANPPLEDLVARVGPAVVGIETTAGRGSGFFVQKDTIVTNAHVAGNDMSVRVRLASGETLSARVDRIATDFDLAILKLPSAISDQTIVDLGEVTR